MLRFVEVVCHFVGWCLVAMWMFGGVWWGRCLVFLVSTAHGNGTLGEDNKNPFARGRTEGVVLRSLEMYLVMKKKRRPAWPSVPTMIISMTGC